MTRFLAILNLVAALLVSSCLVFGLAMRIAPEQTARFLWHLAGPATEANNDFTIIGGDADSPTAIFISSRTPGCTIPTVMLFALFLGNAIVLWRRRGIRPAAQSAKSDRSDQSD